MNQDTERMSRLADLRDRICRGAYRVDPWLVADALLTRSGDEWAPWLPPRSGPPAGASA